MQQNWNNRSMAHGQSTRDQWTQYVSNLLRNLSDKNTDKQIIYPSNSKADINFRNFLIVTTRTLEPELARESSLIKSITVFSTKKNSIIIPKSAVPRFNFLGLYFKAFSFDRSGYTWQKFVFFRFLNSWTFCKFG